VSRIRLNLRGLATTWGRSHDLWGGCATVPQYCAKRLAGKNVPKMTHLESINPSKIASAVMLTQEVFEFSYNDPTIYQVQWRDQPNTLAYCSTVKLKRLSTCDKHTIDWLAQSYLYSCLHVFLSGTHFTCASLQLTPVFKLVPQLGECKAIINPTEHTTPRFQLTSWARGLGSSGY